MPQTTASNQRQRQQQSNSGAIDRVHMQRINVLVNSGALQRKELPMLKLALRKQQAGTDVARLPKKQRDILTNYYQRTSNAALGSQQAFTAVKRNIMASVEHEEDNVISEAMERTMDPPQALLLQRKGIRIFPDGRKVAMYVNKKLGLVFTIPYAGTGKTQGEIVQQGIAVQAEEVESEEIMESLEQVAKFAQQDNVTSNSRHFKFADGSKLKVSHGAAKAIHMVHGALNDENKKKFADMLTTPKGFEKAAHFALSKVQFTIGDE